MRPSQLTGSWPLSFSISWLVLGCIKGLPPALASRRIAVKMLRAVKTEAQSRRSLDDSPNQETTVRDSLHSWALEHAHRVVTTNCEHGSLANRDAELWGPLLSIVADTGDEAAFDSLLQHAELTSEAAASDAQPEFDELILRALHELRTEDLLPTPGEVLERAKTIDPEALDESWKPRGISAILKRYDFATKKSNSRRIYRDAAASIRGIATRYDYDVDGGEK